MEVVVHQFHRQRRGYGERQQVAVESRGERRKKNRKEERRSKKKRKERGSSEVAAAPDGDNSSSWRKKMKSELSFYLFLSYFLFC